MAWSTILASILLVSPTSASQSQIALAVLHGPSARSINAKAMFKWFDHLDFDEVKHGRFVRLKFSGSAFSNTTAMYGFVNPRNPNQCLTIGLDRVHRGKKQFDFIGFSPVSIRQFARTQLRLFLDQGSRQFPPDLLWDSDRFVMARACAASGLAQLAKSYLASLPTDDEHFVNGIWTRESEDKHIRESIAWTEMQRFHLAFKDSTRSWVIQLAGARRLARLFGNSGQGPAAREAVRVLAAMVDDRTTLQIRGNKVATLIHALPTERATESVAHGAVNVFWPSGLEDAHSAAHKLADLRFAAVPQLISALADRRFTHCVGGEGVACVLRVGDVARQILENISARRFDRYAQLLDTSSIPVCRAEVTRWWATARRLGELDSLKLTLQDSMNQEAAGTLVKRYPGLAPTILANRLASMRPNDDRSTIIEALGDCKDTAAREALRREAITGPTLACRIEAATELVADAPKFSAQVMIKEWNRFSDPPASGDPNAPTPFRRKEFVSPMLRTESTDAVASLGDRLRTRTVEFRHELIEDLLLTPPPRSHAYIDTVERLLVGELDDADPLMISGYFDNVQLQDPEMGDLAALTLAKLEPARYHFNSFNFHGFMRRQRSDFKNLWLESQGQEQLAIEPLPPKAPTAWEASRVTDISLANESAATSRLAEGIRATKTKPLAWDRLFGIFVIASTLDLPKGKGVCIRLTRELPGGGLTLTADLGYSERPLGFDGGDYQYAVVFEGKEIINVSSTSPASYDMSNDQEDAAKKCLKSTKDQAFTMTIKLWPSTRKN